MLQRLNKTQHAPSTVGYKLDGHVDAVAYETLGREIQNCIKENGEVNVLLEIGDIDTASASGLLRAFKEHSPDAESIRRIAWVTDKPTLKVVGKVASILPNVNLKNFDASDDVEAWRWVATGEMPSG